MTGGIQLPHVSTRCVQAAAPCISTSRTRCIDYFSACMMHAHAGRRRSPRICLHRILQHSSYIDSASPAEPSPRKLDHHRYEPATRRTRTPAPARSDYTKLYDYITKENLRRPHTYEVTTTSIVHTPCRCGTRCNHHRLLQQVTASTFRRREGRLQATHHRRHFINVVFTSIFINTPPPPRPQDGHQASSDRLFCKTRPRRHQ